MKFVIIFILFLPYFVFNQNTGYMGKHWTSELNLPFMFCFTDYAHLNIYPELNLNYTIGRRVDIGFSTSIDIAKARNIGFQISPGNYYRWDMTQGDSYATLNFNPTTKSYHLLSLGLDFQLRIYGKKFIAPLGFYHQFNVGKYWSKNIDASTTSYFAYDDISDENIYFNTSNKFNDYWKIGYTLGRKIGFKNNNYFTFAFNSNIVFGTDYRKPDRLEYSWYYNYFSGHNQAFFNRLEYMFQYKIGIGRFF